MRRRGAVSPPSCRCFSHFGIDRRECPSRPIGSPPLTPLRLRGHPNVRNIPMSRALWHQRFLLPDVTSPRHDTLILRGKVSHYHWHRGCGQSELLSEELLSAARLLYYFRARQGHHGIHGLFVEAKEMQTEGIKEQARRLLESLPDSATWEDLIYQIYVRQAIEAGIRDSNQGKTVDVKEVRRRFGLPE